jgi:hypothetical protein
MALKIIGAGMGRTVQTGQPVQNRCLRRLVVGMVIAQLAGMRNTTRQLLQGQGIECRQPVACLA